MNYNSHDMDIFHANNIAQRSKKQKHKCCMIPFI